MSDPFLIGAIIYAVSHLMGNHEAERPRRCQLCYDQGVHWNGQHFVHSDGDQVAITRPLSYIPEIDKEPMKHLALPVDE